MSEKDKVGYGAQIKKYREAASLLQSDVARHFGTTPQAVQQWESNDTVPRGRRLAELASLLKCSVSDLMFGDGSKSFSVVRQVLGDEKYAVSEPPMQDMHSERNKVPVFRWPRLGETEQLISFMHCPIDCERQVSAYLIEDSSASPDYSLRGIVFVQAADEPDSGKAVVYRLADGRTVLRIAECDGLNTYLKAINKDWPDKMHQVVDDDKLVGVVIGKWVPAK